MSTDEVEERRIQGFYSAMSNDEFLALLGDRSALTVVAQRALAAEAGVRGFVLPADDAPPETNAGTEVVDDAGQEGWIGVISFSVMAEADQAAKLLEEHGIPFRLEDEQHFGGSGVRRTQYNALFLSVEKERRAETVDLLHAKLKLFPGAEIDERAGEPGEDEGALMQVADYDSAEDAAVAEAALRQAGIWFRSAKAELEADADAGTHAGEWTYIEVRFDDLERAGDAIEAAFPAADAV